MDDGGAVLVDVREPEEHAAYRIAGAKLVPLSAFTTDALPDHVGKKLVMQCKGGVRSHTACEMVAAKYPTLNVFNLEGGIAAWAQAGLPVETQS